MTNCELVKQTSLAAKISKDNAKGQQDMSPARGMPVAMLESANSRQFVEVARTMTTPARILRLPEVMSRVGLKRASIYQHIAIGSFPKQIALGTRAVGWLENEIDAWLAARIQERYLSKAHL